MSQIDSIAREFHHHRLLFDKEEAYRDWCSRCLFSALSENAMQVLSSSVFSWGGKRVDDKMQPMLFIYYPEVPASILEPHNWLFLHELTLLTSTMFGVEHIRVRGSDMLCDLFLEGDRRVMETTILEGFQNA